MFCFSKTCRICKCTTNSFTSAGNIQNELSHLFFTIFPELRNSKLNHFLKNVCTFCMKQLTLFDNFKNECIQSDQCFMQYINSMEDHDGIHGEFESNLDIKLENCLKDIRQTQSTLESNDIHGATNYYNSTVHSIRSTDIEINIKHETCTSEVEENIEKNEGNNVNETNSAFGYRESDINDIGDTIIKQETLISDYDEFGSQGIIIDSSGIIRQDVSSIPDTKKDYCQRKDYHSNNAEDGITEIDIVKHEISISDKKGPHIAGNVNLNLMGIESMLNNDGNQKIAYTTYCQKKDDMIQQVYKDSDIQGTDNSLRSEIQPESTAKDDSTRKKPYPCDMCKKSFLQKIVLIRHQRIHTGEKLYECDICKKSFVQKSYMIVHKRTHTGEKPYECDICKRRFTQKQTLITHKRMHTGIKPYVCDVCGKAFADKSNMTVHKKTHIDKSKYKWCDICKKNVLQKFYLNHHKRMHTSEKPYECDICKKTFSHEMVLTNHKRTHTGERPYECDICKNSFVQLSHLICHKRTHSGEKPYECDICKKSFSRKDGLIAHKSAHTGEKPYMCDVCEKSFVQKSHMIRHKKTHTGEKSYECDICKEIFSQKLYLMTHKKMHTAERPYVCEVCKFAFKRKCNMMRHKRYHCGFTPNVFTLGM